MANKNNRANENWKCDSCGKVADPLYFASGGKEICESCRPKKRGRGLNYRKESKTPIFNGRGKQI